MSTENQTPAAMPTSEELFRSAMEPDAAPPPPAAEPPTPTVTVDETGRAHGPDGRYVPQGEQTPQAPAAATVPPSAPPPEQPVDQEGAIPSWRLRELREERDRIAAERAHYEQMARQYHQENAALRARVEQPQPEPEPPDPATDPNGYHRFITQQHQQSLRDMEANFSFRMAHRAHGEVFERAWNEMYGRAQRGDPAVIRHVMSTPDPGEAMVNWYTRESTLALVGPDPDAWADQRMRERIAKDPKLLQAYNEIIRNAASATNSQGAPHVQLPPSLNRMPASAPVAPGINGMPSNEEMFAYAFREGRDRR